MLGGGDDDEAVKPKRFFCSRELEDSGLCVKLWLEACSGEKYCVLSCPVLLEADSWWNRSAEGFSGLELADEEVPAGTLSGGLSCVAWNGNLE